MISRFLLVLLALAALASGLAYLKYGQTQAEMAMFSQPMPAPVVDVAEVRETRWEPTLKAVGSVAAVQGVAVSNQVAGQVREIRFDSGATVTRGQILVLLDDDVDQADLEGLQAAERLAGLQLKRNTTLLKDRAVSQGDVDELSAQLDQARARVKSKQATIDKKVIRAPFDGQLGIRQIDLGQFLPEGTPIVQLQALDPIYVDYALPEREITNLRIDQAVRVRVAAHPDETFEGAIAAITPSVEKGTRSVQVRMKFTDLFVRRPVLASVVSLLIFILGLRAFLDLEVRQYPKTQNTVVTITTAYPGASSDLVKGFITTPLQQAIAEADGIDYLAATSTPGSR
jgi:membrane fusion protein, multidrug efflux system